MRYSRTLDGPQYLSSTAVVMSELLKFTVCLGVHVYTESKTRRMSAAALWNDIFGREVCLYRVSVFVPIYHLLEMPASYSR
jgi:hypothetical protein